jgi:hypothetical protein
MKKVAAYKGLSAPDEKIVCCEHLHAGAAASDLATVKDSLRIFIATSRPPGSIPYGSHEKESKIYRGLDCRSGLDKELDKRHGSMLISGKWCWLMAH